MTFNLLLILGGMLAGPLLLSHHLARHTLRGLVVQRRLPRAVCAGDLLVVHVAILNNRRRIGCWILALEDSIRRIGGASKRNGYADKPIVMFPYIAARQTASGDYRGRLAERGRYRLGPMRASTRFPFGLFRYSFVCGTTATLTVLPRLGRPDAKLASAAARVVRRKSAARASGRHRRRLLRLAALAAWR